MGRSRRPLTPKDTGEGGSPCISLPGIFSLFRRTGLMSKIASPWISPNLRAALRLWRLSWFPEALGCSGRVRDGSCRRSMSCITGGPANWISELHMSEYNGPWFTGEAVRIRRTGSSVRRFCVCLSSYHNRIPSRRLPLDAGEIYVLTRRVLVGYWSNAEYQCLRHQERRTGCGVSVSIPRNHPLPPSSDRP